MKRYLVKTVLLRPIPKIFEVEAEKENRVSIWIDGHRRNKVSNTGIYFDTKEEAHNFLKNRRSNIS